jgi:glycine/D-amino acid oxidase-like deaminating enzyme
MNVDFLIIGQGLCGTFLSWNLLKAGKTILVIDESQPYSATKVASGVINPVTGRRIVRTWRIEELLPFALEAYSQLGNELNAELIKETTILDFHPSLQMKEAFDKRLSEGEEYLQIPHDADSWKRYFNFHFGVGAINPCLLLNLNTMLSSWRQKLKDENNLLEDSFLWEDCKVYQDYIDYKNITAKKVICCDGVASFNNPYFKNLPYAKIKGEAVIASIPELLTQDIYKQGINIVPWNEELFWIGSSYEWSYDNINPSTSFRKRVEDQLKYWLKLPYVITDHLASERPATIERRPFVGLHPHFPSVAILNGMGTKGCSLAPFFAKQLTELLTEDKPIYAEADVRRFQKILMP